MEIRRVRYSDILGAPNAQELLDAYSAECSIPEIGKTDPQPQMYEDMEKRGMLACFGAYVGGNLVGFGTLVTYIVPHYGLRNGISESLFVDRAHRKSSIGLALLAKLVDEARKAGCVSFQCTAPVGSALDRILSAKKSFRKTNHIHTCPLQ